MQITMKINCLKKVQGMFNAGVSVKNLEAKTIFPYFWAKCSPHQS